MQNPQSITDSNKQLENAIPKILEGVLQTELPNIYLKNSPFNEVIDELLYHQSNWAWMSCGRVDGDNTDANICHQPREYYISAEVISDFTSIKFPKRKICLGGVVTTCVVVNQNVVTTDEFADWLHFYRSGFIGGRSYTYATLRNENVNILGSYIPTTLYASSKILRSVIDLRQLTNTKTKRLKIGQQHRRFFEFCIDSLWI